MVKIGLIGCGNWGKHILRDLKTLGAHVSVVAPGESSRANALAGKADAIVPALNALPAADGYVVAVPTALHAQVLESLVASGKPIFCEKPLTPDLEAARRLVEQAGERIFVMDKWRYHAGILALRDIARSGELGPVLGIKTRRVQWQCPHNDVSMDWILLPHDLTIALEILGFVPEAHAAFAETREGKLIGLTGFLQSGGVWMESEVGIRSPTHSRCIEVRCRDGLASIGDAYDEAVVVLRTEGATTLTPAPSPEFRPVAQEMPLYKELKAFVEFVRDAAPAPKSSAAEGLLVVQRITELRRLAGLEA